MAASSKVSTRRKLSVGFVVVLITAAAVAAAVYISGLGPGPVDPGLPVQPAQALPSVSTDEPKISTQSGRITKLEPTGKPPTKEGIAAQLAPTLTNPALTENFKGVVMDPATGVILWDRNGEDSVDLASTTKLITGAALLASGADPQARLTTKVVVGDEPGDVVLVGGGDVTLSARTTGTDTVYVGAAHINDLAQQVIDSGYEVKRILLDTSYWSGPLLADGWDRGDIAAGDIAPMQPLMIDGARRNPASERSPRSSTPALDAGKALASALGNSKLTVVENQTANPDAQVLGQVQSQPLALLLAQALQNSDNVLAESLAREVSKAMGGSPSFQGATESIRLALESLKITIDGKKREVDLSQVEIFDGSGMSKNNKAPSKVQAEILTAAVQAQDTNMRLLITGLPVAGATGTLADRFCSGATAKAAACEREPNSKVGRGWVRAKTGSILSTYALAGLVIDKDDRILVFSFNSAPADPESTRAAQDVVAAALRNCGCS